MIFGANIAVEWPAGTDRGPSPKKEAIRGAVFCHSAPQTSQYLRNRHLTKGWLCDLFQIEITAGSRVLARKTS